MKKDNYWYIWIILGISFIIFGIIMKEKENNHSKKLWWLWVVLAILIV